MGMFLFILKHIFVFICMYFTSKSSTLDMQKLLESLINSFFRNQGKSPSPLFIESSKRYLEPSAFTPVGDERMEKTIKARSYGAHLIYRRIKKNNVVRMLCYVLINVCNSPLSIVEELARNIRKGALGFEISYFTETNIILLRERIDTHLYGIVFQVYQNACIYKKLRSIAAFHSKAHLNFYEIVRRELEGYEKCVIGQEEELLSFYAGMYSPYIRLQIVHQLNECFRDNPKKPFDFLKLNFHSNHFFYGEVLKASCLHIDGCLREFIAKGDFVDSNREFFICRNVNTNPWDGFTIDFGLVPYFISNRIAEKVLYIGKCAALLREDGRAQCISGLCCCSGALSGRSDSVQRSQEMMLQGSETRSNVNEGHGSKQFICSRCSNQIYKISVLDPNLEDGIDTILKNTNRRVEHILLEDLNIYGQIEGVRKIFLFGRCDFVETLFLFLKDTKRVSRKSFSYILDAAIRNTYGRVDGFTSKLGVYLIDNENKYENFALFCQLDHPTSLILSKEIILKLVTIFQILWRLKRVEHLLLRISKTEVDKLTRIRIALYTGLVYKISYFMFEEVISQRWRFVPTSSGMPLNDLKSGVEKALDGIMDKGCVSGKGLERFLSELESSLMSVGMGTSSFDDAATQQALREFFNAAGDSLAGTLLFDLHKYLTVAVKN